MILCDWDAPEGDPGQSCVHLFARFLLTSFTSVSIFSVCCYSSVSISIYLWLPPTPFCRSFKDAQALNFDSWIVLFFHYNYMGRRLRA
jgi:hypothetical protein